MNKEDTELEIMECYKKMKLAPVCIRLMLALKYCRNTWFWHWCLKSSAAKPSVWLHFYNCSGNATYSLCEIAWILFLWPRMLETKSIWRHRLHSTKDNYLFLVIFFVYQVNHYGFFIISYCLSDINCLL